MFKWFDRNSILCTDELATYNWFGSKMRQHHKVTHSAGEYAQTEGAVRAHTNTAEGFFVLFKMGLVGIHHSVSSKHLHRSPREHTFRYSTRYNIGDRLAKCLIGQHGRLRLRELFV